MSGSLEFDLIHWLQLRVGPAAASTTIGIGDDAAVLAIPQGHELVVTTDAIADGTDFRLNVDDPRRIGRKALAVNLSDIAAMGAKPTAAFVSLMLPRHDSLRLAQSLYEGMFPLLERYAISLAGGDTNTWDGPLTLSITLLGTVKHGTAWRRGGGQPGDTLLVTGPLGGSILGHHFDFEPRVSEALWLQAHAKVHAAMDISDGLALDASRLAAASQCGIELDLDRIPISEAAKQTDVNRSPLQHALGDGEDFELLLAIPADEASRLLAESNRPVELYPIGRLVAESGLWGVDSNGRRAIPPTGYLHGASP